MKKKLAFIGVLLIGITAGAATTQITVNLENVKFNVNGVESIQQAIVYENTTYVPLRKAAELLGTKVNYKDDTVYLEKEKVAKAFDIKINDLRIGKDEEGNEVAIINMDFTNKSGYTTSPLASFLDVTAFQNGIEIESTFDDQLAENDSFTSVLNGYTLNYDELFIIKDHSPITIEIEDYYGDGKTTKVLEIK